MIENQGFVIILMYLHQLKSVFPDKKCIKTSHTLIKDAQTFSFPCVIILPVELFQVVMGTLELRQSLTGHRGRVWNVCWHPLGSCVASCGEDKTIRIWVLKGSQWVIKAILTEGHTRTIREIAWSPCGNYIASVSFDATVAIWDKKSGQFECNTTLEGHENEVKSVSWSCSGQLLATCSRDKSVWVWEVNDDDYECAAVINAHSQDVKKVYSFYIILFIRDGHWSGKLRDD